MDGENIQDVDGNVRDGEQSTGLMDHLQRLPEINYRVVPNAVNHEHDDNQSEDLDILNRLNHSEGM